MMMMMNTFVVVVVNQLSDFSLHCLGVTLMMGIYVAARRRQWKSRGTHRIVMAQTQRKGRTRFACIIYVYKTRRLSKMRTHISELRHTAFHIADQESWWMWASWWESLCPKKKAARIVCNWKIVQLNIKQRKYISIWSLIRKCIAKCFVKQWRWGEVVRFFSLYQIMIAIQVFFHAPNLNRIF